MQSKSSSNIIPSAPEPSRAFLYSVKQKYLKRTTIIIGLLGFVHTLYQTWGHFTPSDMIAVGTFILLLAFGVATNPSRGVAAEFFADYVRLPGYWTRILRTIRFAEIFGMERIASRLIVKYRQHGRVLRSTLTLNTITESGLLVELLQAKTGLQIRSSDSLRSRYARSMEAAFPMDESHSWLTHLMLPVYLGAIPVAVFLLLHLLSRFLPVPLPAAAEIFLAMGMMLGTWALLIRFRIRKRRFGKAGRAWATVGELVALALLIAVGLLSLFTSWPGSRPNSGFARYDEPARRVIFFARDEAGHHRSPTIEPQHLLLGIIREDSKLMTALLPPDTSLDSFRAEIESEVPRHQEPSPVDLPLSIQSKRILAYAAEESDLSNSRTIGTAHLLLGILREHDSLAARVLREKGLDLPRTRELVKQRGVGRVSGGKL